MTQVLIVDDQPRFCRHLRRLLTHAGLEVVGEAGDIPAAEALLETIRPELAVVDLMLPGLNGLEGIPRLKRRAPGLRVFLVSAHRDPSGALPESARRAGAEAFLLKEELDLDVVQAWVKPGLEVNSPGSQKPPDFSKPGGQ